METRGTYSDNVIVHDGLDELAYETVFDQARALRQVVEQGQSLLPTFSPLSADIFYSLYKPAPTMTEQSPLTTLLNREYMSKLVESSSYKALRDYTVLDDLGAGLGSKSLLEALVEELRHDPDLKRSNDTMNQAANAAQHAQSLDSNSAEYTQAVKQATDLLNQVAQQVKSSQAALRKAVERAADKAMGEVEQTEQLIQSWGLEAGGFHRLPLQQKLAILQTLQGQHKFRDMGKLIGRMRQLARSSRKSKLPVDSMELHSITTGNPLSRLLPQEFVTFRHPILKRDFFRRFTERQLLEYDLTAKQILGQGPIVVLIDTSSSMNKNGREEWSKAVALGLAEIAAHEKRAFCYALFSSSHTDMITAEAANGKMTTDNILTMAQGFIGGGTDFEKPLTWALQKLSESKFHRGDIVMITDGECSVSDEFLEALQRQKEQQGFSLYSVLIGNSSRELTRWSDTVWEIRDLLDDTTATELYEKI